ncbi:MAG: L-threonylcarbamoyladenylate synthase [Vicinamibacterales bacterium]
MNRRQAGVDSQHLPPDLTRAAELVRRGGLIAYPTDTFYGLACDPRNEQAVARLFAAKGRAAGRASPLIGGSLEQLSHVVEFTETACTLAAAFWPGPLSLVLRSRAEVCSMAIGGLGSAAVRVPADAIARALADAVGFCITATSANISGEPPVTRASAISAGLIAHLDYVLDGGELPGGAASTLVDATDAQPRLLRAGAIAWERVLESLR